MTQIRNGEDRVRGTHGGRWGAIDAGSTTERGCYDEDPGTNYSQARYLCYYLQQQGLLGKYYHEFVRNAKDDPTGYQTLQRVLGEEDMEAFQAKWTEFVLGLRF